MKASPAIKRMSLRGLYRFRLRRARIVARHPDVVVDGATIDAALAAGPPARALLRQQNGMRPGSKPLPLAVETAGIIFCDARKIEGGSHVEDLSPPCGAHSLAPG